MVTIGFIVPSSNLISVPTARAVIAIYFCPEFTGHSYGISPGLVPVLPVTPKLNIVALILFISMFVLLLKFGFPLSLD